SAFVSRFSPMKEEASHLETGEVALLFRVALVHAYRIIRFRDPRLPNSVLPADWPGAAARRLFADVYSTLSEASDTYIGEHFLSRSGTLPTRPKTVSARLKTLATCSVGFEAA
ncbi:MAG: PaaX family transcriptional regulator, partial [Roseibium sp.]|uniref:PaaX family transcriptional regulator C-terminal domain-containing protein n=1 Tax=Roseibium sp. TaxID=1936156 RepID=UPI002608975B